MKLFCMISLLGFSVCFYAMDRSYEPTYGGFAGPRFCSVRHIDWQYEVPQKGISYAAYKAAFRSDSDLETDSNAGDARGSSIPSHTSSTLSLRREMRNSDDEIEDNCPLRALFKSFLAAVEYNLKNAPSYSDSSHELMALIKEYKQAGKHIFPLKATPDSIVSQVDALLKQGADPTMHDEYGHTPLHEVVDMSDNRSYQVAKLLLEHGACVESKNVMGLTPFESALAERSHNRAMFKLLLAHVSKDTVQKLWQTISSKKRREFPEDQQLKSLLNNRLSLGQPVRPKIIKERIMYVNSFGNCKRARVFDAGNTKLESGSLNKVVEVNADDDWYLSKMIDKTRESSEVTEGFALRRHTPFYSSQEPCNVSSRAMFQTMQDVNEGQGGADKKFSLKRIKGAADSSQLQQPYGEERTALHFLLYGWTANSPSPLLCLDRQKIVAMLLQKGALLTACDDHQMTTSFLLLKWAIKENILPEVKMIVEENAQQPCRELFEKDFQEYVEILME